MRSPVQLFAYAVVQVLLFVLMLPIVIAVFIISMLSRKFDWRSVVQWDKWLQQVGQVKTASRAKTSKSSSESKSKDSSQPTYDVGFEKKKN